MTSTRQQRLNRWSRRAALKLGATAFVTGLAGCSNREGTDEASTPKSPSSSSVFQDISFEDEYMVVRLREGHDVDRVNLIASDGSIFAHGNIAEGATTVRLKVLDIDRGWYYTLGRHELVAISGDDPRSISVNLNPELKITEITQYTGDRPTPSNYGNLAVTVENAGTGPTWIFNIGYEDAPYERANTLRTDPTFQEATLIEPEAVVETLLLPGKKQTYVGSTPPFIISNADSCNGWATETTVIVQSAVGRDIEQRVRATFSGEMVSANFRDACTNVTVEMLDGGASVV